MAEHSPGPRAAGRDNGLQHLHPHRGVRLASWRGALFVPQPSWRAASLHTCRAEVQLRLTRQGPCWQAVPRSPCRCFLGLPLGHCRPQHPAQIWGSRGSRSPELHERACWQRGRAEEGCGTHSGEVGTNFGFTNPETSLRMARVPDVLSKAPSLGSPWDGTLQSQPAPPCTLRGGPGSLLWEVAQPWLVPCSPICCPLSPRLLQTAEKA